ncbi:MAG TPA: SPOR domain-containing protein [Terriglobales bacterium]|nr:SPOR domain-containing protein [Terriglobales bacterium]
MPTSEDTEITLGTGKMLALFFGLVALCAVFFSAGFSLGKHAPLRDPAAEGNAAPVAGTLVRPSAVKAVRSESPSLADTALKSSEDPIANDNPAPSSSTAAAPPPAAGAAPPDPLTLPATNGYYVQVAAVSKQEDADALVDALKKKQYPAFSANVASDKLLHVELGPYSDIKEAEVMRAKLINDGYNPILKK